MLDFVQPLAAGRQLIGFGWEAWRDEPGREGTLQHAEQIKSRNGERNWAAGPCVGQLAITRARQDRVVTSPGPSRITRRTGALSK
jgi:hypothetical protein